MNKADQFPVDLTVAEANTDDFDALVLPGGTTNPDALRMDSQAMDFVRSVVEAKKPVAAICHGLSSLVEADVLRGKTLTSWPSLRTDISNAGGSWVDQEVKVCPTEGWVLVTSRNPDDLPAFNAALIEAFSAQEDH